MRNDIVGRNNVRLVEVNHDKVSRSLKIFAQVVKRICNIFVKRVWKGRQHIPTSGGFIIAANHISNIDPVFLAEFVAFSGRWPRFLAKQELFNLKLIGGVFRSWRMISVDRTAADRGKVLDKAAQALAEGDCVAIYPESTFTLDPDGWPMSGQTGCARLALATKSPVIPIAQWGANELMPGIYLTYPRLFPRKTVQFVAGKPIDLSDLYDMEDQRRATRIATERIMKTLTDMVAEIRQLPAPEYRYDRKLNYRVPVPNEDEL